MTKTFHQRWLLRTKGFGTNSNEVGYLDTFAPFDEKSRYGFSFNSWEYHSSKNKLKGFQFNDEHKKQVTKLIEQHYSYYQNRFKWIPITIDEPLLKEYTFYWYKDHYYVICSDRDFKMKMECGDWKDGVLYRQIVPSKTSGMGYEQSPFCMSTVERFFNQFKLVHENDLPNDIYKLVKSGLFFDMFTHT